MKNLLHAEKRAENHFRWAIEVAREIGAKNILAQANLGMGLLSLEMNETSKAEDYLSEAVDLFGWCEADIYLKQAESALASCQERSSSAHLRQSACDGGNRTDDGEGVARTQELGDDVALLPLGAGAQGGGALRSGANPLNEANFTKT